MLIAPGFSTGEKALSTDQLRSAQPYRYFFRERGTVSRLLFITSPGRRARGYGGELCQISLRRLVRLAV